MTKTTKITPHDAALECAKAMLAFCGQSVGPRQWGEFASRRAALTAIAAGNATWGDVCDDNVFRHETLVRLGMLPEENDPDSWEQAAIWNEVSGHDRRVAGEILANDPAALKPSRSKIFCLYADGVHIGTTGTLREASGEAEKESVRRDGMAIEIRECVIGTVAFMTPEGVVT